MTAGGQTHILEESRAETALPRVDWAALAEDAETEGAESATGQALRAAEEALRLSEERVRLTRLGYGWR